MRWELLVEAAQRTDREAERRYSAGYREYVRARDDDAWWAPAGPTASDAAQLLEFLNHWGSRMTRGDATVRYLAGAGRDAALQLAPFRYATLLSIELSGETGKSIARAFEAFAESPSKRYTTGAAKALHMMNRAVFGMWDSAIRRGHGVRSFGNGTDYVEVVLSRAQSELREAVATYVADGLASQADAETALEQRCAALWHRPLAKIADEFNYWEFTQAGSRA